MEGEKPLSIAFKKAAEQEARQCEAEKRKQKFNRIVDIIDLTTSTILFLTGLAGSFICKTGTGGTFKELQTLYIPFLFTTVINGTLIFLSSCFRKQTSYWKEFARSATIITLNAIVFGFIIISIVSRRNKNETGESSKLVDEFLSPGHYETTTIEAQSLASVTMSACNAGGVDCIVILAIAVAVVSIATSLFWMAMMMKWLYVPRWVTKIFYITEYSIVHQT